MRPRPLSSPSELQEFIREQKFPEDAAYRTTDHFLRAAIYEAFEGKCFYSGRLLTMEEMRIDHLIPRSQGGPDNVYNFVPSSAEMNYKKGANADVLALAGPLTIVRLYYAKKILNILKDAENRKRQQENRKHSITALHQRPLKPMFTFDDSEVVEKSAAVVPKKSLKPMFTFDD